VTDAAARALGRKIAFHRAQRGWSQRDFGALIDRSETWVSQVERGVRRVDRMTVLRRVAEALDVPVGELAVETPVVKATIKAAEPAHQLRLLFSASLALNLVASPPRRIGSIASLTKDVETAWTLAHGAEFGELIPLLTKLLPRLEATCRSSAEGADRQLACVMLARAYHAAAAVLAKLGDFDAAWIAADRAIAVGERAGDPVLMAAGAFRLSLVFQADRRHDQARETASTAVSAIDSLVRSGNVEAVSVAGALRLQLAVSAARVNDADTAYAELDRARKLAEGIGGDRNDYNTEFGPTNVGLHEVSVAVDVGDAGRALRVAAGIDAAGLSPERQSRLLIDVARAHLQRRNPAGVVRALLDAERLAPEQVHRHALVKNVLYDLVRSDSRSDPRVRGLAQRCGVRAS
jgi:transcriptional regulator with XRE-family HTH domain